jgi:hypothetical protein
MSKIKVDRIENSSGNGLTFPAAALSDGHLNISSTGVMSSVPLQSGLKSFSVYDARTDGSIDGVIDYYKTIPADVRASMIKHPFRIIITGFIAAGGMQFRTDSGVAHLNSTQPDMYRVTSPTRPAVSGRNTSSDSLKFQGGTYITASDTHASFGNNFITVVDGSITTHNDTTQSISGGNREKSKMANFIAHQMSAPIENPTSRQDYYAPIARQWHQMRFYHEDWTQLRFYNVSTGRSYTNDGAQIKILIRGD